MLSQDKYTSNKLYMDRFTNARDMIKHMGGSLPNYPALIDVALKKKDLDWIIVTPDQTAAVEAESVDWNLAAALILCANKYHFENYWKISKTNTHKLSRIFRIF